MGAADSAAPRIGGAAATAPEPRIVSPFNPANAVTASRFLCLPPFAWAVDSGHHQWATLIILVCGLLDKLDGLAARIFDCRSPFGELFDAITDGICYGFGAFANGFGLYCGMAVTAEVHDRYFGQFLSPAS